jgi:hypothetical protein
MSDLKMQYIRKKIKAKQKLEYWIEEYSKKSESNWESKADCLGTIKELEEEINFYRRNIREIADKNVKEKLKTEDLGKIFEYAICKAFNVEYKGKFKYDVKNAVELCEHLNLYKLKEMFPDFEHTANGKSRYDFTSKDGKSFLSSKTSKHKESKIAPQCIGQPHPKKFCKILGIEFINNTSLQIYIEKNIEIILDKFIEYTFDCPIIYFNQELKSVKVVSLENKIEWKKYKFSWTRPLTKGSAILHIYTDSEKKSEGILEIQFHNKSRKNMTNRWMFEKLLKIFPENFKIVSI